METATNVTKILENNIFSIADVSTTYGSNKRVDSRAQNILIIQSTVASVGIVANLTVCVVFLNHKKLRRKIPNVFIINQVRNQRLHCFGLLFKCCMLNCRSCLAKNSATRKSSCVITHEAYCPCRGWEGKSTLTWSRLGQGKGRIGVPCCGPGLGVGVSVLSRVPTLPPEQTHTYEIITSR